MPGTKGEPKRRYARIYINRREQLIKMVVEDDKHINKAAKKLGIKYSTAKLIIKKYKETGTLFVKHKPTKDEGPKAAPATPSPSNSHSEQARGAQAAQQIAEPVVSQVFGSQVQVDGSNWWFYPQMPFYGYPIMNYQPLQ